jgi:hypothetical protein
LSTASGAAAGVKVGDTAPPFSAGSWTNLPKGMTSVSMKDLQGRVVLLDFWATW